MTDHPNCAELIKRFETIYAHPDFAKAMEDFRAVNVRSVEETDAFVDAMVEKYGHDFSVGVMTEGGATFVRIDPETGEIE